MPKLSPTQLEKLQYGTQGWNEIMESNARLLDEVLLLVEGMIDVNVTSLANNDMLVWDTGTSKFVNVPFGTIVPITTTTTTTTTTSSTTTSSTTTTTT